MRIPVRAVVMLMLALAACGGSEALDDAEYLEAVDRALGSYHVERNVLTEEYLAALESEMAALEQGDGDAATLEVIEDQAVELTRAGTTKLFASIGDALSRLDAALRDLAPPADLAALHAELVRATQLAAGGVPGLLDAVGRAEDFDALDSAIAGSVFTDAQPRLQASCARLAEEAAARAVTVDLSCGG